MIRQTVAKLRPFLAALSLSLFLLPLGTAQAKSPEEIDVSVRYALQTFIKDVKGAEDYLKNAKGVLVMADVKKAGLGVGAQWGEGALMIGPKTVDYYKMQAGTIGMQAGYQDLNLVFVFLTDEAVNSFRASGGWTAGMESGIVVVDASTPDLSLGTLKAKSSVVAFAFGKAGLMAGWSARGTKFSKI
jgi:lipid-binding SYLF domain-containing protein